MPQLYETPLGRIFYGSHVPALVKNVGQIVEQLKILNKSIEKNFKESQVEESVTVMLLRPDYIADEFGKDTFTCVVRGSKNVEDAIRSAQEQVVAVDYPDKDNPFDGDYDDYHVLMVVLGEVKFLR